MAEQLKNSLDNPTSTLASGITSGALSLTVASGHGSRFPATGNFRVKLTDAADDTLYELVICTARASDALTITRAAEGTTARAFAASDLVDLVLTEDGLETWATERFWPLSTDLATQAELDAHTGDTSDAHDASAVSVVDAGGYFTGTDLEAVTQELGADVGSQTTDLANHLADPTDAHAATAITNTPAGNVVATTAQAAINELDTEKASLAFAIAMGVAL